MELEDKRTLLLLYKKLKRSKDYTELVEASELRKFLLNVGILQIKKSIGMPKEEPGAILEQYMRERYGERYNENNN